MVYENPAEEKLQTEHLTCVVYKNGRMYSREGIGVRPLMACLGEDAHFFEGACVADKVVGKAAALLIVYGGGAEAVYGGVMSDSAIRILEERHIPYRYGERVAYIQNRTHTGMCPLEEAVADTDDPSEAFAALKRRIAELMANR